jgi:hypothetical protein
MRNPEGVSHFFEFSYLAVSRWKSGQPPLSKPLHLSTIVTPPKTPPHKKVSHKNFRSLKQETRLKGGQKIAFSAPTRPLLADKQKQK